VQTFLLCSSSFFLSPDYAFRAMGGAWQQTDRNQEGQHWICHLNRLRRLVSCHIDPQLRRRVLFYSSSVSLIDEGPALSWRNLCMSICSDEQLGLAPKRRMALYRAMSRKLKMGVVGAGVFGGYHANKCAAHPRVEYVGTYDKSFERAPACAESGLSYAD